jgi:N-acetylneuraminic acid mutarotase
MKGIPGKPLRTLGAAVRGIYLMAAVLALVACHGSSNSSSYTIGGTISGLAASSVVLANGSATVTIAASSATNSDTLTGTTWSFPSSFTANSSYAVVVQTQPVGELCVVTSGGTGSTLTGNLSDVAVVCSNYGEWIWYGGSNAVNASGAYGTQGAGSASNEPGARYAASSWTDSSGDLWLFGGIGYDSAGVAGYLNDLWQYSPSTGLWTWVSGAAGDNANGVYGTQGTALASNIPGARQAASSWTDSSGNLWLFGGYGYDSTGALGRLNDLWRYSPGSNQWTWVSGGSAGNAAGVYGTQGTASVSNVPGARYSASSWTDSSGNLWLFGGYGYDSTGGVGNLNDLWRYSATANQWTWVGGGSADNAAGLYGTEDVASASNVPGARQAANSWTDPSGNLWLFGGYGYDSAAALGYLNDLWTYSPSTGLWTWTSGSSGNNSTGVYGTQGTPSASNLLGARQAATSWVDSSGNFWVFGGVGYDSAGDLGTLSDLWEYSPGTRQWKWVSGGSGENANGEYDTQGTSSASGAPGARYSANSWYDATGNKLWLFGGAGYASAGNGSLNDLWQFVPP